MQAKDICLLASRIAKGGTGMVSIAGQCLNLVLEDLKLKRDLKINRVTQLINVGPGTYGPFALEADYLRTYDLFYTLPGSSGLPQFLNPVTMETFDAEVKTPSTSNYPYEFATDLSTQVQVAAPSVPGTITSITPSNRSGGYLAAPALSFVGPGTTLAATPYLTAIGVSLWGGGAGYSEGDFITAVGGVFTRPLVIQRLEGGGIFNVADGGAYSVVPGNPRVIPNIYTQTGNAGSIPTSGGTGAGMTLLVTWGLGEVTIQDGGANWDNTTVIQPNGGVSGVAPNVNGTYTYTLGPAAGSGSAGELFIYPQSSSNLVLTHRHMKNQPDIVDPSTSTQVPWFPYTRYLIDATAAMMMGITGDDRQDSYEKRCEDMLRPFLIMEGDEQSTVRRVTLDPRHFRAARTVAPTKTTPF